MYIHTHYIHTIWEIRHSFATSQNFNYQPVAKLWSLKNYAFKKLQHFSFSMEDIKNIILMLRYTIRLLYNSLILVSGGTRVVGKLRFPLCNFNIDFNCEPVAKIWNFQLQFVAFARWGTFRSGIGKKYYWTKGISLQNNLGQIIYYFNRIQFRKLQKMLFRLFFLMQKTIFLAFLKMSKIEFETKLDAHFYKIDLPKLLEWI